MGLGVFGVQLGGPGAALLPNPHVQLCARCKIKIGVQAESLLFAACAAPAAQRVL